MNCNLVSNAPPQRGSWRGPTKPLLIGPLPSKPQTFADVDALARHIHRRRGQRGLRIARTVISYNNSDTIPAFAIWWLDESGEEYAFTAAVQSSSPETLRAALADNNPDVP